MIYDTAVSQSNSLNNWNKIESSFVTDWVDMQVNPWPLDFREFFNGMPSAELITMRDSILTYYDKLAKGVTRSALPLDDQVHFDHLCYFLDFHKSLLSLSKIFHENDDKQNMGNAGSIFEIPNGIKWYELFVRKYTSVNITPDSVFNYGLKESEILKKKLTKLPPLNDNHEWISDAQAINTIYNEIAIKAKKNLALLFPVDKVEKYPIGFRPILPSTVTTPPAYYSGPEAPFLNYNYLNQRHDVSDAGWLYLHECVPGHHLQAVTLLDSPSQPFFHSLIQYEYNGLFEGWGCYVEEYGYQAGIYQDRKSEYAFLRWNLIRSMRLCIDVGINYYGWPTEKAITFWNTFLPDEPALMEREINRCKRWPAQALSYKIGAAAIARLKHDYLKKNKKSTEKDFHTLVLNKGMIPVEVLIQALIN